MYEDKEYTGRAASKGIGYGMAVYIGHPSEITYTSFKEGDVLVVHNTNVDFLSLMRKASAVVTAIGGKFSHASVICQQLNKPCVVGMTEDISVFAGNNITVNGTTGKIFKGKRDV